MKITYITMLWPALSETFAIRDVRALIKQGCNVDIIALRPDFRSLHNVENVQEIPALRMGLIPQFKGVVLMLMRIVSFIKLTLLMFRNGEKSKVILKSIMLYPSVALAVQAIEKLKPDIVHLFWGHYPSMVAWMLGEKKSDIPFTMFLGPYDLAYDYKLTKIAVKDARFVFTHVKPNVEKIIDLGVPAEKVECVFRGIEMVKSSRYTKKDRSYIFVGRLMTAKGIYELIDVFAHIHQSEPQSFLTIIGDGEEKDNLIKYINKKNLSSHVNLVGWKTSAEVLDIMQSHKIMLFFSHLERLPNAVKEAMMMGAVPISSRTTGIEELIDHDKNGVIVNYNDDPKQIATRAIEIMNDNACREKMAKAARQTILGKFDVTVSMKRYVEIWSSIKEGTL